MEIISFYFTAHLLVANVIETGKGGALDIFDLMIRDDESEIKKISQISLYSNLNSTRFLGQDAMCT